MIKVSPNSVCISVDYLKDDDRSHEIVPTSNGDSTGTLIEHNLGFEDSSLKSPVWQYDLGIPWYWKLKLYIR